MKHYIFSLLLIILILLGAFFFAHNLYYQEINKLIENRTSELKTDTSITSAVISHFLDNSISNINLAALSFAELNSHQFKTDYIANLFKTLNAQKPLFNKLSYINNNGTPLHSYPLESNDFNFLHSNRLNEYIEQIKTGNSIIIPPFNNKQDKIAKQNDYFIMGTQVLNNLNEENNGFILGVIDIGELIELIQIDNYFKSKSNVEYFLVNTITGNIIASPPLTEKNKLFYELSTKFAKSLKDRLFISDSKSVCVSVPFNNKCFYVVGCRIKTPKQNLSIIGIAPNTNTNAITKEFIRKSSYLVIYVLIFILIIGITLTNFIHELKKLKKQVTSLKIEINKTTAEEDKRQITESEYFLDLQKKIENLKDK